MSHARAACLALSTLSLACAPGSVSTDEIDAFGRVRSALWTSGGDVENWVDLVDGQFVSFNNAGQGVPAIRLFSSNMSCEDYLATRTGISDAAGALLVATDNFHDNELACDMVPDYFEEVAAVYDEYPAAQNALVFTYCAGDDCSPGLTPGSYDLRSQDVLVTGTLSYAAKRSRADAFREAADSWDSENCALKEGLLSNLGVSDEAYTALTGSLDVEEVENATQVSGTFSAAISSNEGSAGNIEGSFDAEWCDEPDVSNFIAIPGMPPT